MVITSVNSHNSSVNTRANSRLSCISAKFNHARRPYRPAHHHYRFFINCRYSIVFARLISQLRVFARMFKISLVIIILQITMRVALLVLLTITATIALQCWNNGVLKLDSGKEKQVGITKKTKKEQYYYLSFLAKNQCKKCKN